MTPLRADVRSSQLVAFRMTPEERAIVERASHANRQRISDFIRDALLEAASDCLEGVNRPSRRGRMRVLTPSGV